MYVVPDSLIIYFFIFYYDYWLAFDMQITDVLNLGANTTEAHCKKVD